MKSLFAICMLLSILCASILAGAQSTDATLSGIVVDPSGRIVQDADIEILNEVTGIRYSSKTNDDGIYTVTILPPGEYRVQVSKAGFKTLIKPGIVLNVQSALALNFTLPIGATSESITVEAGAAAINTTDGSVSTVIDRDFVENMPLNGRSFQDLLTLSPGVSLVPTTYSTAYVGYSGDIVVNGLRTESNYFTVDGVSANTGTVPDATSGGGAGVTGNTPSLTALGTTQSLVSLDALQEFRSTTSTYSAEYGRSPGGQFSFSTRSGTNALHGSLFDYLRNNALDASNWFNDYYHEPKGREQQNDFGGTAGGRPFFIPRAYNGTNKSFFFFSYEGLRLVSPQAAQSVLVPDSTLRQQSPAALQPLLNAFPVANSAAYGSDFSYYIESISYPSRLDSTSIRLDHAIGTKLHVFGRYADSPSDSVAYNEAVRQATDDGDQSTTIGATYTPTAHQANDVRFNFTHNSAQLTRQSTNLGGASPLSLSSLPGPNNNTFPQNDSELYAVFTFADFINFTLGNYPSYQHQLNITDTHNWILGRHSLKAGIDWRSLTTNLASENPLEEIAFTNDSQVLSNAPAAGIVQAWGTSKDEPVYVNLSSFLQDEWKVTSRFALSVGLRWDINPAPTNVEGSVPYTVDEITNLATTQLAPHGTPLWKTDWLGFAPRIGMAYQLHPNSERNTVLRAGFGVFYDSGNSEGSAGFGGIGFESSEHIASAAFPLTSAQLTLPAPSVAAPYTTTVIGFDPNLKLPYSLQYNAAIEHAFSKRESVTLGYVGSGGRRLLTSFLTYPAAVGNPNFSSGTELFLTDGRASSAYNSLQVKYQRTIWHGLQALGSYTWSHSIDNASSNYGIYYLLRASSNFDIRQNLQAALSYEIKQVNDSSPVADLLNDWGFDFRLQARTAVPVDIIGNQVLDTATGQILQYQPNLVPGQPLYLYGRSYPGGRSINYNAFASAAAGVQGDLPRNYARAFGIAQLDTALRRDIPLHDQLHLQFRAEAFNIFNHPMFGAIYNRLSEGQTEFGAAYNTANTVGNLNSLYEPGGPRSLQLSMKLAF